MRSAFGLTGWNQPIDGDPVESDVVGIVCSSKFPDTDKIRNVIQSAPGDVVFLVRDRDAVARAALDEQAIEYVTAPLNPLWKTTSDHRSAVRDNEIIRLSRRVIVFTTPDTATLDYYSKSDPLLWGDRVRVILEGKVAAKKHRKGRKID